MNIMVYVHIHIILLCWLWLGVVSAEANLDITQFLVDGTTLESSNAVFKLGFFSPRNSTNRYVGIWYNDSDSDEKFEVVWVANRENPLTDSSGVLKISEDGNLQVFNGQNKSLWSSNVPAYDSSSSIIRLLDTGNLVLLSNAARGTIIWQSFYQPTDVFLPNMSFTIDGTLTEKQALFRSWKSPEDPSGGNFTLGIKTHNLPQLLLWNGDRPYWRNPPWVGDFLFGLKSFLSIVTDNTGNIYFGFSLPNQSAGLLRLGVNYDGSLVERSWDDKSKKWETVWNSLQTECSFYGKCGPFASCKATNSPICTCLRGFVPNNNIEWSKGNWTGGCVRRSTLPCGTVGGRADGFWKLQNMKVPDDGELSSAANEDECRSHCLGKCSCLAYAYCWSIGCMTWNASLIDIEELTDNVGYDLSVRLAYSELGKTPCSVNALHELPKILLGARSRTRYSQLSVEQGVLSMAISVAFDIHNQLSSPGKTYAVPGKTNAVPEKTNAVIWQLGSIQTARLSVGAFVILWFCLIYLDGRRQARLAKIVIKGAQSETHFGNLPMFELEKLMTATNNFQESNKLGRGGFGIVYKGKLEDGVEVAVKRLSKVSGQGLTEFMTEVLVISKLQHQNLVRLLGCCVEGEEKLLVYEYMPNKSLDALLFDRLQQELLDWKTRFNIVQGICRGILYLHRDSRLKIIHRDLKASNILLDDKLIPKISDFGMARIFEGNEDQADTNRVVGTYGYMSPEYAMEGRFSEKSDVFSFGVLLLEIVSGRRNGSFRNEESLSLLAHAWKLRNEDKLVSLIDPAVLESSFQGEIVKCIHIALLCVQELPEDRPNIAIVISMIDSEASVLPQPTQPGFTQRRYTPRNLALQDENANGSVNYISLSGMSGR